MANVLGLSLIPCLLGYEGIYNDDNTHSNIIDMCGVAGKRRTSDLNVTGSRTMVAKDIYAVCCWSIAQIS